MPTLKTRNMQYTRRIDLLSPQSCDVAFDRGTKALKTATTNLREATHECIVVVAKMFVRTSSTFGMDRDLDRLVGAIRVGISDKDLIPISHALRTFLDKYDRSSLGNDTPESSLVVAMINLQEAIGLWCEDEHQRAYSDTVRCRASLAKIAVE